MSHIEYLRITSGSNGCSHFEIKTIGLETKDYAPPAPPLNTSALEPSNNSVLFERAMRLSPEHPWSVPSGYGVALHLVGRKDDAVASFKRAIALKANHVHPHAFLAAVYADLGRID